MILSRVANRIYWMARYIERAENTARMINVFTHLLLDLPKQASLGWEPIIDINSSREFFHSLYPEADENSVVRFMITDTRNPGSVLSSLNMARENARTIRDIIPKEAWEQINSVFLYSKNNVRSAMNRRHRYEYMRAIIVGAQTNSGLLSGTMTHDECYDFLRMGRNLERADMTTRIIDVRSASLLPEVNDELTPFGNLEWMSVLKSLTAYQMYRREMRLRISRPDVLKFLLQHDKFPRSLSHTLLEVESCLNSLPRNEKPLALTTKLRNQLKRAKPQTLKQEKLHEFIDKTQLGLIKIHNEIDKTYF